MINVVNERYVNRISIDDMIEGGMGNMDDSSIDSDLKLFRRVASALKVPQKSVVVVPDGESEYLPEYIDAKVIKKGDGWNLYEAGSVNVVAEYKSGICYLYFRSDNDVDEYINMFNSEE